MLYKYNIAKRSGYPPVYSIFFSATVVIPVHSKYYCRNKGRKLWVEVRRYKRFMEGGGGRPLPILEV
jgi:hypothetical protein